ncbi:MAG: hypothetical protein ACOX7F_05510 [Eubacteriales bacterium]|jgi:hypothetical protein
MSRRRVRAKSHSEAPTQRERDEIRSTRRKLIWFAVAGVCVLGAAAYYFSTHTDPSVEWARELTPETVESVSVLYPNRESKNQYHLAEEGETQELITWLQNAQLKRVEQREADEKAEDYCQITLLDDSGTAHHLTDVSQDDLLVEGSRYTVQEGYMEELIRWLENLSYEYSPDFQREYEAFVAEKGFTQEELEHLTELEYEPQEIIQLSEEEYFRIFPPGNHYTGGIGYEPNADQDTALYELGIDDEKHTILANLGYSYTEMITMTQRERDFIFPNDELVEKLASYGIKTQEAKAFGRTSGKSFKELIRAALEQDQYSQEAVDKMKAAGLDDIDLAILFNKGYSENELMILLARDPKLVVQAALPGSEAPGEQLTVSDDAYYQEKLKEKGLDTEGAKALMRLGYSETDIMNISQEELDMALPTSELVDKLAAKGVPAETVLQMLERGSSFKTMIDRALGK